MIAATESRGVAKSAKPNSVATSRVTRRVAIGGMRWSKGPARDEANTGSAPGQ